MGIYLNPSENGPNPHKDMWLLNKVKAGEVQPVNVDTFKAHKPGDGGKYGLVFVANGPFDAIGVAFDAREVRDFSDMRDNRPKAYFIVHEDKIKEWDSIAYKTLKA